MNTRMYLLKNTPFLHGRNKSCVYFNAIAFFTLFLLVGSISNIDTEITDRTKCFHVLTGSDGQFHSANFPGLYPNGVTCTWLIRADPGKRIKLIFTEFELEDLHGCAHDSLSIFDGNSTKSPFLGNFCGTSIQEQIFSSSNSLFLLLYTNDVNSMKGFHAFYTTYSCGGIINTENGTIHSPFFPHYYRSNSNCIWRIPAKLHHHVILTVNLYAVKTLTSTCKDNYVRISSLDEIKRTKQHELYCVSILHEPLRILSEGSGLEVEYSSTNVIESVFAAKFYTVQDECSLNISNCDHTCEKTIDGYVCSCRDGYKLNDDGYSCSFVNCSYSLNATGLGEILSAGYPHKYPAYHSCKWRITADKDEQIFLKFEDFGLENSPGCRYDGVEIYEENGNASSLLGIYCGQDLPMPISSARNNIVIFFRTDGSQENKGFKIKHITSKSCGGKIYTNSNRKTISSPFFPGTYPDNLHCVWEIAAPELHVIVLSFTAFDLQTMAGYEDKVMIFSTSSENESHLLGEFSGSHIPRKILSDNNNLKVYFVSHKILSHGTGFSAEVHSEENECLINNGGCSHVCNKAIGSYTCSCSKGYLFVHESNTCVKDICQYEVNALSGDIKLPDFENIHPINNTCHWIITTEDDKTLFLNLTMLRRAECIEDQLEVYFGNDITMNSSGNLCSENSLTAIFSPGNQIYLVYTKNSRNQTSTFLASFFSVIDECALNNGGCQHGCTDTLQNYECTCPFGYALHENKHNCIERNCYYKITSSSGVITSPQYPSAYPDGIECAWLFKTIPGIPFNLTFTTFDVEYHTVCVYDKVRLFNGDGEDSPLLGQFCGNKVPFSYVVPHPGNNLYMTFTTDAYMSFRGFNATYMYTSFADCGNTIFIGREQHLYSHVGYGQYNYADNYDFCWLLIADAHKRIVVSFQAFNLEVHEQCAYDYVIMYEDGFQILKSCGNSVPPSFSSEGNVLLVKFHSDGSNTGLGFAATFRSV